MCSALDSGPALCTSLVIKQNGSDLQRGWSQDYGGQQIGGAGTMGSNKPVPETGCGQNSRLHCAALDGYIRQSTHPWLIQRLCRLGFTFCLTLTTCTGLLTLRRGYGARKSGKSLCPSVSTAVWGPLGRGHREDEKLARGHPQDSWAPPLLLDLTISTSVSLPTQHKT